VLSDHLHASALGPVDSTAVITNDLDSRVPQR
jgi:hypothetical protein